MNYWIIAGLKKKEPKGLEVISATCDAFGVAKSDIMGLSRKRPIVRARMAAIYILRRYRFMKYMDIATLFGRDHTVAIHAISRASELMKHDTEFIDKVKAIISRSEAMRDLMKKEFNNKAALKVVEHISAEYGITTEVMVSQNKSRNISDARKASIMIMRDAYGIGISEIGRLLDRNHSTIINAYKKAKNHYHCEERFRMICDTVSTKLKAA